MESPIDSNPDNQPGSQASPASPQAVAVAIDPAVEALKSQFLNGVGWFYWIGGLSIVNIGMSFVDRKFLFGLGIAEIIDAMAQAGGRTSMPLLALSVAISLGFIALGYQGRKGKQGFILAGLVIYALDAGLLLIFHDWLSAAFHAFAGYSIFKGYGALKQILGGAAA